MYGKGTRDRSDVTLADGGNYWRRKEVVELGKSR